MEPRLVAVQAPNGRRTLQQLGAGQRPPEDCDLGDETVELRRLAAGQRAAVRAAEAHRSLWPRTRADPLTTATPSSRSERELPQVDLAVLSVRIRLHKEQLMLVL